MDPLDSEASHFEKNDLKNFKHWSSRPPTQTIQWRCKTTPAMSGWSNRLASGWAGKHFDAQIEKWSGWKEQREGAVCSAGCRLLGRRMALLPFHCFCIMRVYKEKACGIGKGASQFCCCFAGSECAICHYASCHFASSIDFLSAFCFVQHLHHNATLSANSRRTFADNEQRHRSHIDGEKH